MAQVSFADVRKVYPDGTEAVKSLTLDIPDGELMVFVGPSGCGKTTALRMVAGLEVITEGEVRIGDEVVNGLLPRDRDVAMVFQNYALYPHMTVAENLGFGLRLRGTPRAEIARPIATRWRWPPESCRGLRSRWSSSPMIRAVSPIRFLASSLGTFRIFSAKPMFSATVMCGYSA